MCDLNDRLEGGDFILNDEKPIPAKKAYIVWIEDDLGKKGPDENYIPVEKRRTTTENKGTRIDGLVFVNVICST